MNNKSYFFRRAVLALLVILSVLLTACGNTFGKKEMFKVGVLNLNPSLDSLVEGFKAGMVEQGYIDGQNVTYIYDGAVGDAAKLDAAAQKLVDADVDLILSITTPATQAAQRATAENGIPVVFGPVTDPVKAGVVQSLRSPGGNITGVSTYGSEVKRLQWEIVLKPEIKKIYVPYNPDASSTASLAVTQETADQLGVQLITQEASTPEEVSAAVASMPEDIQAIFILSDGFTESQSPVLIQAAMDRRIPISTTNLDLMESGVLLGFGHRPYNIGQQLARLGAQILAGTNPGDLPVETSEFFLVINLKTANAIGLDVPDTILSQANEIIR